MRIALDYDGTYTADVGLWDPFLEVSRARGHLVYIVTMRFPNEPVDPSLTDRVERIIYTGRTKKRDFLLSLGLEMDIWIDDQPHYIFENAPGGLLRAWRSWRTGVPVEPVVPTLSNEVDR